MHFFISKTLQQIALHAVFLSKILISVHKIFSRWNFPLKTTSYLQTTQGFPLSIIVVFCNKNEFLLLDIELFAIKMVSTCSTDGFLLSKTGLFAIQIFYSRKIGLCAVLIDFYSQITDHLQYRWFSTFIKTTTHGQCAKQMGFYSFKYPDYLLWMIFYSKIPDYLHYRRFFTLRNRTILAFLLQGHPPFMVYFHEDFPLTRVVFSA